MWANCLPHAIIYSKHYLRQSSDTACVKIWVRSMWKKKKIKPWQKSHFEKISISKYETLWFWRRFPTLILTKYPCSCLQHATSNEEKKLRDTFSFQRCIVYVLTGILAAKLTWHWKTMLRFLLFFTWAETTTSGDAFSEKPPVNGVAC